MARRRTITFDTAKGEDRWMLPVLTEDQIRSLEPSCEMVYAARALGISRNLAYAQCKTRGGLLFGDDVLPARMVSGAWRVKKADLLSLLGLSGTSEAAPGRGSAA